MNAGNPNVDVATSRSGTVIPRNTALDPRNASLVQPFKRLVDEGFITELNVVFTPSGFTATGKPDSRISAVEGSGLTTGTPAALGIIAAAADKGNLIPKKQGNVKKNATNKVDAQPLPLKTLVPKDFEGTDAELIARMRIVAAEGNGGTLIGRVRSAGRYMADVTLSYQDWWARAGAKDRALSLCQHKMLAKLSDEMIARLDGKPCPFRGTAQFIVSEEAEDSDHDDDDTVVDGEATT